MNVTDAPAAAARILIVDDQAANIRLLRRILGDAGYTDVASTMEPRTVERLVGELHPDLIVLDLQMPGMNGLEVLRMLAERAGRGTFLPVLVITGDASREARERALAAGASDFLTQPFDSTEALLRIGNLLHTRRLHLQLEAEKESLERRVEERSRELVLLQSEILDRLGRVSEFRSDATASEHRQVARATARLARAHGVGRNEAAVIAQAAIPYDVGMSAIPDRILMKRGQLNESDRAVVRLHTTYGRQILSGGTSELLQAAAAIALLHHERWDGSGYPLQHQGESIPLSARIVGLADAFVAMLHPRPYRPARSLAQALGEVAAQKGRQFDPALVDAFLGLSWEPGSGDREVRSGSFSMMRAHQAAGVPAFDSSVDSISTGRLLRSAPGTGGRSASASPSTSACTPASRWRCSGGRSSFCSTTTPICPCLAHPSIQGRSDGGRLISGRKHGPRSGP
jgi:putative two-component system response regulator